MQLKMLRLSERAGGLTRALGAWARASLVGGLGLIAVMRPALAWAQDSTAPDRAVSDVAVEEESKQAQEPGTNKKPQSQGANNKPQNPGTQANRWNQSNPAPWNRGADRATQIAARELFREGYRLFRMPLYALAAERYQEALHLWQHPAFYYNLAIAQINLVQPIEAYKNLEKAMEYGPEPLGGDAWYQQAEEYHTRLEAQLGVVEVACDESGAEVLLDGKLLFTAPGKAREIVLPGSHLLVARKRGLIPETKQAVVSAGDKETYRLVLRGPDKLETKRYMPEWIPWVGMGAGGLLLTAAGYMDWGSSRDIDHYDAQFSKECPFGCIDGEKRDLVQNIRGAERRKYIGIGLYTLGGAAFVTSAVLVYVNRERVVRREVRPDEVTVVPLLLPEGMGVGAMMRFE